MESIGTFEAIEGFTFSYIGTIKNKTFVLFESRVPKKPVKLELKLLTENEAKQIEEIIKNRKERMMKWK